MTPFLLIPKFSFFLPFLPLLLLLLTLPHQSTPQKLLLISSSIGYYNIRQVNNIVNIYHHARNNGFNDQDILLVVGQLQPCCEKNHVFSGLSFYDGDYRNIFRNVQVDFWQSGVCLDGVGRLMMGLQDRYRLNKRKFMFNPNKKQPLLIYLTGHGGDLYFKIRQKQALISPQFTTIFSLASTKLPISKTALISDSCSAITPFQNVTAPNFIALGSSSYGEKSLSHGYDAVLNQPKTDDFSYYFDEILGGKGERKDGRDGRDGGGIQGWSFRDVQKYMDIEKLKVNSKLISNNISKNEKISTFFKKQPPKIQTKSLKNVKKAYDFFNS